MRGYFLTVLVLVTGVILTTGCNKKSKVQEDKIYSRHLQRYVQLSIYSTPLPEDKSSLELLLLNDGQEAASLGLQQLLDSLYDNNAINPLVVVAIHAGDRTAEYGVAEIPDVEQRGSKADKYNLFIDNELYAYVKKKAGVRKFKSVTIAGMSQGGLSAIDIAWNNSDKIDQVGVFSGAFWWRDKATTDSSYSDDKNRILLQKIRSSRKRPKLKYWLYAGSREETADRDKDGITDVVDDTRDLAEILRNKKICPPGDIVYVESPTGKHDYTAWARAFPGFLVWAAGK